MRIIAFILLTAALINGFSQPAYTHKQKITLQQNDDRLTLHCRTGQFIISFNPADLTYPYPEEKQKELAALLNRKDTADLDSLIEKAADIVRDTNMNFCNTRFSSMITKCFLTEMLP